MYDEFKEGRPVRIDSTFHQPPKMQSQTNITEKAKIEVVKNNEKQAYEGPKEEITKEKLERVVESLNRFLEPTMTSLHFKLHEELNEYYVELVDSNTSEVIREIPSKKMLDMYAEMTKLMGVFVDEKI